MSETLEEDINLNNNAIESENNQIDALDEMKSKVVITETCREVDNKKKMLSKNIQVEFKEELSDGIVFDMKYEVYWQELAEVKRIELEDALEENKRLYKLKENLMQENVHYQKLLQEANSFVEVIKEVIKESPDDTGIDVRDVNDSQNE